MSDAFFPFGTLVRDKIFLASFGASLLLAIATVGGISFIVATSKIVINPISRISYVTDSELLAKPISQIDNAQPQQQVFHAYVASLEDICHSKMPGGMKSIVIVQTRKGMTAGTTNITPRTCELLKKLGENASIYAASDEPFEGVSSHRQQIKYVRLEGPKEPANPE